MPVKISVVPSATANSTVDIPDETKREVEDLYKSLQKSPGNEAHITFKDEDERVTWTRAARAYAATRDAGALKLRQLPSKNLPANEARFQLTADLPANGAREGARKPA